MKTVSPIAVIFALVAAACGNLSATDDNYITARDLAVVPGASSLAVRWNETITVSREDGAVDFDRVLLEGEQTLISLTELEHETAGLELREADRIFISPPTGDVTADAPATEIQALAAQEGCTVECTPSNTSLSGMVCVERCDAASAVREFLERNRCQLACL